MKSNSIHVSVSCSTYNHGKFIKQCLDGILNQKVDFKYEILINDDASTDGAQKILKSYQEKYPDIKLNLN
jgi:glycosyltransferase involved in cell wall biosynthesis